MMTLWEILKLLFLVYPQAVKVVLEVLYCVCVIGYATMTITFFVGCRQMTNRALEYTDKEK